MARIRQRTKNAVTWEEIMWLILADALVLDEAERLRVLVAEGHPVKRALEIIQEGRNHVR